MDRQAVAIIQASGTVTSWLALSLILGIPFGWWLLGTLTAVAIHLASYRLAEVRKPALPRRRRRVGPPMEWIDD